GTYGVVSYTVARRTREIGIRIALGARPQAVRAQVVAGALRMAAGGLLVGSAGALAAGQVARGLLFGVSPADPITLGTTIALLAAAAALAAWLPARRGSRVDPVEALRAD